MLPLSPKPLPEKSWREARADDILWAREYLVPWVLRGIKRQPPSRGFAPKRPLPAPMFRQHGPTGAGNPCSRGDTGHPVTVWHRLGVAALACAGVPVFFPVVSENPEHPDSVKSPAVGTPHGEPTGSRRRTPSRRAPLPKPAPHPCAQVRVGTPVRALRPQGSSWTRPPAGTTNPCVPPAACPGCPATRRSLRSFRGDAEDDR